MAKKKAPDANRVVRVVTLPVREVVAPEGAKVIDTFRPAWRLSTDLANWCQRELALRDPGLRTPDAAKLARYEPKMFPGGLALYGRVNAACPFRAAFDGAAGSMSAVVKAVEDAWRTHPKFGRFAVLWKGEARPAVFRFPYPWPVRSQELRILRDDSGRPCASLTLPGGRVVVRLADDRDFRRQGRQFDLLLADPSRVKQTKITGRFDGLKLVGADVRLVGSFDAAEPKAGGPAAVCRTDPHALFVVEIEGRSPWVLNCDHLPRLQAGHKVYLQRTGEDLKFEKRLTRSQRDGLTESREKRCKKHGDRIKTAVGQVVAQVAGVCVRAGCSVVAYDDADRSYIPAGFSWAALGDTLANKLAEHGVEVIRAGPSGGVVESGPVAECV